MHMHAIFQCVLQGCLEILALAFFYVIVSFRNVVALQSESDSLSNFSVSKFAGISNLYASCFWINLCVIPIISFFN